MIRTDEKSAMMVNSHRKCCTVKKLAIQYRDEQWRASGSGILQSNHVSLLQEIFTGHFKLCDGCLSDGNQFFEHANSMLELVLTSAIKLINELARTVSINQHHQMDSSSAGDPPSAAACHNCQDGVAASVNDSNIPPLNEDNNEPSWIRNSTEWLDTQEQLLSLVSRIMWFQFPFYSCYKATRSFDMNTGRSPRSDACGNSDGRKIIPRCQDSPPCYSNNLSSCLPGQPCPCRERNVSPNDEYDLSVDDNDSAAGMQPVTDTGGELDAASQMYCNNLSISCPLLSRNVCFFIDSGGLSSINKLYTMKKDLLDCSDQSVLNTGLIDRIIPSPILSHPIMLLVLNILTWLNASTVRSSVLPLRKLFQSYLSRIVFGEDLRAAFVCRNTYEVFIELASKIYEALDICDNQEDFEYVKIALNCIACDSIHSVKTKGATIVLTQIRAAEGERHITPTGARVDLRLALWLKEHKLIELFFDGHLNTDSVRASHSMITFMAERNMLSEQALLSIWNASRRGGCGVQILEVLSANCNSLFLPDITKLLEYLTAMNPEDHCEQTLLLAANLTRARWNGIIKSEQILNDAYGGGSTIDDDNEDEEDESDGSSSCSSLVQTIGDGNRACNISTRMPTSTEGRVISPPRPDSGSIDSDEEDGPDEEVDSILNVNECSDCPVQSFSNDECRKDSRFTYRGNIIDEFTSPNPLSKSPTALDARVSPDDLLRLRRNRISALEDLQGISPEISPNVSPTNSIDNDAPTSNTDTALSCMNRFLLNDQLKAFDTSSDGVQIAEDLDLGSTVAAGLKRNGSNSETSVKDCKNNNQTRLAVDKKRKRLVCPPTELVGCEKDISGGCDSCSDGTTNNKRTSSSPLLMLGAEQSSPSPSPRSVHRDSNSISSDLDLNSFMNPNVHVLWKLLQENLFVRLPEKLRTQTEDLLLQLLSSCVSDQILLDHFEACVENLEEMSSLPVSIRIATCIMTVLEQAKYRRTVFSDCPTMSLENKFHLMDKVLGCIDDLAQQNQRDLPGFRINLCDQIKACLYLLGRLFSAWTPRSFYLADNKLFQLWDSIVQMPENVSDLLCDWLCDQYNFFKMHAIQPAVLPDFFNCKIISLEPSKITAKLFALFTKTHSLIENVTLTKPDFQRCIAFAFDVLFQSYINGVAICAGNFISTQFLTIYAEGNFSKCHGIVDACLSQLRSYTESPTTDVTPSLRALSLLYLHLSHFSRRFSMIVPYDTVDFFNPLNACDEFMQLRLRINRNRNFIWHRHPRTRFGRLRAEIIDWWCSKMFPNDRTCRIRIGGFRGPRFCDDLTIRELCRCSIIEVDRIELDPGEANETSRNGCADMQGGDRFSKNTFGKSRMESTTTGKQSSTNDSSEFVNWVDTAIDPVVRHEMFNKCCLQYTNNVGRQIIMDFAGVIESKLSTDKKADEISVRMKRESEAALDRVRSIFILLPGRLEVQRSLYTRNSMEFMMECMNQIYTEPVPVWISLIDSIAGFYHSSKPEPEPVVPGPELPSKQVNFEIQNKLADSVLRRILDFDLLKLCTGSSMQIRGLASALRMATILDCQFDPVNVPQVDNTGSTLNLYELKLWPLNTEAEHDCLANTIVQMHILFANDPDHNRDQESKVCIYRATMILLFELIQRYPSQTKTNWPYLSDEKWLFSIVVNRKNWAFRTDAVLWMYTMFTKIKNAQDALLQWTHLFDKNPQRPFKSGEHSSSAVRLFEMISENMALSQLPSAHTFIWLKAATEGYCSLPTRSLRSLLRVCTSSLPVVIEHSLMDDDLLCAFIPFINHFIKHFMRSLTYQRLSKDVEASTGEGEYASVATLAAAAASEMDAFYSCAITTFLRAPLYGIGKLSCLMKESCLEILMDLALTTPYRCRLLFNAIDEMQPFSPKHIFHQSDYDTVCVCQPISNSGYLGIVNLSATCYLASCIQQLFMIPEFRRAVLKTRVSEILSTKHRELFIQLQIMFAYLQYSDQRAFSPRAFCRSYIVENQQPLNVCEQRDMTEFYTDILSKVEEMNTNLKDVVKSLFVGTMRNRTVPADCDHVSTLDEPFTFIQASVTDISTLEQSLRQSMEPEYLKGDNLYYCNRCQKSVPAKRQMGYLRLPKVLAINTLRYTYNLINAVREKINSRFSFPPLIDMSPYIVSEDDADHQSKSPLIDCEMSTNTRESSITSQNPSSPLWYALVGVTVHAGNTDVGHYYSFIKERTRGRMNNRKTAEGDQDTCRWLWFNDTDVKEFDPRRIPSECFGGNVFSFHYDPISERVVDTSVERSNNAYMLFYERLDPTEYENNLPHLWLLRNNYSTMMDKPENTSELTGHDGQTFNKYLDCDSALVERVINENCKLTLKRVMLDNREISQLIWDTCYAGLTSNNDEPRRFRSTFIDDELDTLSCDGSQSRADNDDTDGHVAFLNMALTSSNDTGSECSAGEGGRRVPSIRTITSTESMGQDVREECQSTASSEQSDVSTISKYAAKKYKQLSLILSQLASVYVFDWHIYYADRPGLYKWIDLLTKHIQTNKSEQNLIIELGRLFASRPWVFNIFVRCPDITVRQLFQGFLSEILNGLLQCCEEQSKKTAETKIVASEMSNSDAMHKIPFQGLNNTSEEINEKCLDKQDCNYLVQSKIAADTLEQLVLLFIDIIDTDSPFVRLWRFNEDADGTDQPISQIRRTVSLTHHLIQELKLPDNNSNNNNEDRRRNNNIHYQKPVSPYIDYMCEYFHVLANISQRLPHLLERNGCFSKLISFVYGSCSLSSLIDIGAGGRVRSDSMDNVTATEFWTPHLNIHQCPNMSKSPRISTVSSLLDDTVINVILQLLTSLIRSTRSTQTTSTKSPTEKDFIQLLNILVYITICPWMSTSSTARGNVTFAQFMEPTSSVDPNYMAALIYECLNCGPPHLITEKYLTLCMKQLGMFNNMDAFERIHNGCQQLLSIITSLLHLQKSDVQINMIIAELVTSHIMMILQLSPNHGLQFLIEQLKYLDLQSNVIMPSSTRNQQTSSILCRNASVIFSKWCRDNLGRWVRQFLFKHKQLSVRSKARILLLHCIPIEELHFKANTYITSSGNQPCVVLAEPIRNIRQPLNPDSLNCLNLIVKRIYSILQNMENDILESMASERHSISAHNLLDDSSDVDEEISRTAVSGRMISDVVSDVDDDDTMSVVLDDRIDQAFEFLVNTLITPQLQNLFPVYFSTVWRLYQVNCNDSSLLGLGNRLVIFNYIFHCIRDSATNTDFLLTAIESPEDDIVNAVLSITYNDREYLPYNRTFLAVLFNLIIHCTRTNIKFRYNLCQVQFPAWCINFIITKGTLYANIVQQILSMLRLLLSASPEELFPLERGAADSVSNDNEFFYIRDAVNILRNQLIKAIFESDCGRNYLITAGTVLNLLLTSRVFTLESVVETMLYDHKVPLLSLLTEVFKYDRQTALSCLNKVLSVIPSNKVPQWNEIDSFLMFLRRDIYDPDVIQCLCHILKLYPRFVNSIVSIYLRENVPAVVTATHQQGGYQDPRLPLSTPRGNSHQMDGRSLLNSSAPHPIYRLISTIFSPRNSNFQKDHMVDIAIHFVQVYPEFLLSMRTGDLKEMDNFHDWIASTFSSSVNNFMVGRMEGVEFDDSTKFALLLLEAFEVEAANAAFTVVQAGDDEHSGDEASIDLLDKPESNCTLLDSLAIEVVLCALEKQCFCPNVPTQRLFDHIEQSIRVNRSEMLERFLLVRHKYLPSTNVIDVER